MAAQIAPFSDKDDDIELGLLLEAMFRKYHYDFRGYSMASIKRRLTQARDYFGYRSFSLLQDRLLQDPGIIHKMLSFLTVQVSELFRDPTYYKYIREYVVPHLKTYPSLKIWIAGCSTGEELYSFSILFHEEGLADRTMFYATDINQEALSKAQAGIYPLDRIKLFTDNHRKSGGKSSLSDYYTAAYGSATFHKSLHQRVVFSDHSLVSDQVFAEVHMISCRNVLIYFDRELQDRVIGLFGEALTRNGFLGLGSKESLRFSKKGLLFSEFNYDERIYQRKGER
jgi:chemotaxis protein methyltransferase CheR